MTPDSQLDAFDQHRELLFSIAYRMIGNAADAEDIVQETFIRWHGSNQDEIRSPRAFLVTVLSRLCINHLQSARVQREEYVGRWLPEPLVTTVDQPRVDESLSMAFLLLLERLTPTERAVFLLSEVFDYTHAEVAAIVEKSESNCRQILRRARQHIASGRPRFRSTAAERDELLHRFVAASSSGDMAGLLSLLSEEVVFYSDGGGRAAAVPNAVHGAECVARLIVGALEKFVPRDVVRRLTSINGQPGIVSYAGSTVHSTVTLDIDQGRISAIYVVSNPDKLRHIPPLDDVTKPDGHLSIPS